MILGKVEERKEAKTMKFRKTDKDTETLRHTHGSDVLVLTHSDGHGVSYMLLCTALMRRFADSMHKQAQNAVLQ